MNRLQDLRHGLRALLRAPGSAVTAVACLAIGVAASTAVFSLANGLFLRPLPGIGAPGRVVTVEGVGSYPNVRDLQRSQAPVGPFVGLAALVDQQVSFLPPATGHGGDRSEAAAVLGQLLSGSYFQVLGTRPEVGRLLRPEDESEERSVVVLGHALWRERLGADPDVVGRTGRLNGEPFTVVGVAPEGFIGTFVGIRFDAWVPLPAARSLAPGFDLEDRGVDRVETVARLRPGTTPEQAGAALAVAARSLATAHPRANRNLELSVEPLTGFDPEVRGPALGLVAILAMVAFLVHLTACLNVTGLLLARASARRREMGVRVALGAGRTRVMAGVLAESLLVAVRAAGSLHRLEPPVPFALAFEDRRGDARSVPGPGDSAPRRTGILRCGPGGHACGCGDQPGPGRALLALRLGAVGVTVGGVLSLVAAQGVSSLLFGVAPVDPATYLGVAALLLGTTALGSWAPAIRASRVDPMEVLRQE